MSMLCVRDSLEKLIKKILINALVCSCFRCVLVLWLLIETLFNLNTASVDKVFIKMDCPRYVCKCQRSFLLLLISNCY